MNQTLGKQSALQQWSKISVVALLVVLVIVENALSASIHMRAPPNIKSQLMKKIEKIGNKCVIGLKGLDCPGEENDWLSYTTTSKLTTTSQSDENNVNERRIRNMRNIKQEELPIVAGVGYDQFEKGLKLQVLKSTNPASLISGTETMAVTIRNAKEYFEMLFPSNTQTFYNGLYSHSSTSTDMVFSKYFAGNLYMIDQQKQFFTHNVELSSVQVTEDFQQLINILPDQYDADLYNLVIQSFGDSITTKVKYGGVVDLSVAVKSCFSDPNMLKYLDVQLQFSINPKTDTSKLPNGYIRYHKVGQLDIIGGDPEIDDIAQRILSFPQNPAPIKFETIPIWRAFPDGPKQANMKKAYNQYISSKATDVASLVKQLEAKQMGDFLQPQVFHLYKQYPDPLYYQLPSILDFGDVKPMIAAGQNYTVDEKITITMKYAGCLIELKPIIHRNLDGSFYVDFLFVNEDQYKTNKMCKYTASKLISGKGKNECVKMTFPAATGEKYSFIVLYICSGCMPTMSSDGSKLSCDCPYVD